MNLFYTPNNTIIDHAHSAPIRFFNLTGVFGHRDILMWGAGVGMAEGFLLEQTDIL